MVIIVGSFFCSVCVKLLLMCGSGNVRCLLRKNSTLVAFFYMYPLLGLMRS
jgi:hypothetical protein